MNTPSTTFRPPSPAPARAKPQGKTPLVPVLGGVAAVLLGVSGYFFVQSNSANARVESLNTSLLNIATAAGSGSLSAEDLVNAAQADEALARLTSEIGTIAAEGVQNRATIEQQRGQIRDVTQEREAAAVRIADMQRQLDGARNEAQAARRTAEEAQQEAAAEAAALQAQIGTLTAELEAVRNELASLTSPGEESVELASEAGGAEVIEESGAEAAPAARPRDSSIAVPPGASQLFKSVHYEEGKNRLTFTTLNDQKLVYSNVPANIYDGLATAPVMDVFYRFQIFDTFASDPNDVDVMRELRRR
jgi:hypothetical protein